MCCIILQLTILVLVAVGSGHQASIQTSNQTNYGFGYELLLGRMDFLENTMKESQKETVKLGETLIHELQEFKRLAVDGLKKSQETVQREFQESQKETMKLGGMLLQELQEFKGLYSSRDSGIKSCRNTPSNKSGIFKLKLMNTAFEVLCDQNQYGGGWIVIQHRFDGSVDFLQGWNDYRNGFGSLDGEFWIGLEKIHLITSSGKYELMIHLEDFNGVTKYAHYKKFSIRDEEEKYYLEAPEPYNGTAGDSFYAHRKDKFSTFNQDNDADNEKNLAYQYDSGWWFDHLEHLKSNLNGLYASGSDYDRMHWYTFNNDRQALKVSKMMIRERV